MAKILENPADDANKKLDERAAKMLDGFTFTCACRCKWVHEHGDAYMYRYPTQGHGEMFGSGCPNCGEVAFRTQP